MKNLTPEMIEQAKAAKSAEELLEIAKANNVEMTEDEAATYFAQLTPKSGELEDDDLDSVAGGSCSTEDEFPYYKSAVRVTSGQTCPKCGSDSGIIFDTSNGSGKAKKGIVCDKCKVGWSYKNIVLDIKNCTYEVIG